MQIHELNSYDGLLGDNAFVAVDNGNDTGKVSVPDLTGNVSADLRNVEDQLNARIDNIIAGGTAPSAAEVTDARLGADGVTYPSLGTAIRDQIKNTKAEALGVRTENTFTQGARATSNPFIVSSNNARITSTVFSLSEGDKIRIYNNADGQKFALASSAGTDSGWKTSDYSFYVTSPGYYFVNVAMSDGTSAITPSDATLEIEISYAESIDANKKAIDIINTGKINAKNLIGMKPGYLYPVQIAAGTTITMSTSDGSAITRQTLLLQLFNSDRVLINTYAFQRNLTQRTLTVSQDVSFIAWSQLYPIPLQVEIGPQKTEYVPYFDRLENDEYSDDDAIYRAAEAVRNGYFEISDSNEMAYGTYDSDGYHDQVDRLHSGNVFIPAYSGDRVVAHSDTHDIIVAITSDPFGTELLYTSGWVRTVDITVQNDGYFIFLAKADFSTFDAYYRVYPFPFSDNNSLIAEYYNSEMEKTIESVRKVNDAPALVFPLVTDMHRFVANVQNFDKMIANVKRLVSAIKCDFLINLGDVVEGNTEPNTTLSYAYEATREFNLIGLPYYFTEGNHDNNPYYVDGEYFDISQCFKAWYAATKGVRFNVAENGTDYYIDFDNLNVRLVCLNACNVNEANRYAYGSTTANWLRGSALNTNYTVLLIEHLSSIPSQVWGNNAPINNEAITQALQDFTNDGGIIIQLSGHSHVDLAFVNPWLSIMQVCQKFEQAIITTPEYQAIEGYIDVMGNPSRTAGTYTEDAWSVCVLKPFNDTLHMIRFGAGIDRIFHYVPIAPGTVSSELEGNIAWSTSDASVATVNNGVITPVAAGKCAVLAKDTSGNYECWIVRVV